MADIQVIGGSEVKANLNQESLRALYLGRSTFDEVKGLVAVDYAVSIPVRLDFLDHVLGISPSAFRSHWSRLVFTGSGVPLLSVRSETEMLDRVRSVPNAVGYVSDTIKVQGAKVLLVVPRVAKQNL